MNRARICVVLLLLTTLTVYWQTGSHDFVNYDDNIYVTDNPQVLAGLKWAGVKWAFTSNHAGNWHPLTWLSHMADVELYGLNPQGHHLTSAVLHGVNVLLLFLLLVRSTGDFWPSIFTAALFALHPLRVESVAWVAERKDVLSTLFALLTLLAYVRYTARPRIASYLLLISLFILGLLSKPMLVTLPFVMLLLDYWPLNRFNRDNTFGRRKLIPILTRRFVEKVPLIIVATISGMITFLAQQHGRSVASLDGLPLQMRFENALNAYVSYLSSFFYPVKLAAFYPLPMVSHPLKALAAGLLLATITIVVIRSRRHFSFLVTGWFWYLGTLLPVIGLIQVGGQARADRYTYIPMIGVALMIAWWGMWQMEGRPARQRMFGAVAAVALLLLSGMTWRQIGTWRDSQTLFRHAIAVTDNNHVALSFLGSALFSQNQFREAARYYALSLSIMPQQAEVHHNLALGLNLQGNHVQAERHFRDAIRLMPDMFESHFELGALLVRRNDCNGAMHEFNEVLRLRPDHGAARQGLELCRKTLKNAGVSATGL